MDVQDAMTQIAKDRNLATEFSQTPEAVLKRLGVETSCLSITRPPELQQVPITVCSSVGVVLCVSVGSTVGKSATA